MGSLTLDCEGRQIKDPNVPQKTFHSRRDALSPSLQPLSKRYKRNEEDLMDVQDVPLEAIEMAEESCDNLIQNAAADSAATRREGFGENSLIALELRDFQVSTRVVYRFKPTMNLIIGANGTGKSTIITAIFLIFLGDVSKLERRQDEYSGFVQTGKIESQIQVVLQGGLNNTNNDVVRMVIPALKGTLAPGQKRPTPCWYINEVVANREELQAFVESRDIQVNNLTQFLPQTRVAEFSGENAAERLLSTELAVGYDGMLSDHQLLCECGSQLDRLNSANGELSLQIKHEEEKCMKYRDALDKLHETERRRRDIEYLEQLQDLVNYEEARKGIELLVAQVRECERSISDFTRKHINAFNGLEKAVDGVKAAELNKNERASEFVASQDLARSAQEESQQSHERLDIALSKLEQYEVQLARLNSQIKRNKQEEETIPAATSQDSDKQIIPEEKDKLQQRVNDILAVIKAARPQRIELQKRIRDFSRQLIDEERLLANDVRQLNSIKDSHNRTHSLQRLESAFMNPEVGRKLRRAIEFVQKHMNRFKRTIHMPAIYSATIKDSSLLPQVGAVLNVAEVQKFVCECKEDFETLTQLAAEAEEDLNLRAVDVSGVGEGRSLPVSQEDLRTMGFDGVLSDIFEGPEAVMRLLRATSQLSRVPFARKKLPDSTPQKLRDKGFIGEFVDEDTLSQIQRSRFGEQKITTSVTNINRDIGRLRWAEHMCKVDSTPQQNAILQRIDRRKALIQTQKSAESQVKADLKMWEQENTPIQHEYVEVNSQLVRAQQIVDAAVARARALEHIREQREMLRTQRRDLVASAETLVDNVLSAVLACKAAKVSGAAREAVRTDRAALRAGLSLITCSSVERRYRSVLNIEQNLLRKNYERAQQELDAEKRKIEGKRVPFIRSRQLLQEAGRLEEAEKEVSSCVSIESVQMRASTIRAELALNETGDTLSETRASLESSETRLAQLQERFKRDSGNAKRYATTVEEVGKGRWIPRLRHLVNDIARQYSAMFTELGCRGTVQLTEHGNDFSKWGIEILVAFRDGEDYRPLSKQRQSGGERAVSTACYLLSLQDRARVPFRVLDEINQGMDELNERRTYQFILERSHRSQTQLFLVTPKLMPSLPYATSQQVTIIFSSSQVSPALRALPSSVPALINLMEEASAES